MLLTRVLVRPCSARLVRSSSGRSTRRLPSSWRTVISPGRSRSSVPLGPLTVTWRSARVTSTPDGTVMGVRPMRDMEAPSSPDEAEDLAADTALARLTVGEQPLAGGQDGDAEAAEDARQLVGGGIDAQAGLGHPADAGDGPGTVGGVLHAQLEHPAGPVAVGVHVEALDVA